MNPRTTIIPCLTFLFSGVVLALSILVVPVTVDPRFTEILDGVVSSHRWVWQTNILVYTNETAWVAQMAAGGVLFIVSCLIAVVLFCSSDE